MIVNVDNLIIFDDNAHPSIIFPVGKPENGGSCAFLTEHCLSYCPVQCINEQEKRALQFFRENTADVISERLLNELVFYNSLILYWCSWGDILPELSGKVLEIVLILQREGVVQLGFTRNKPYWESVPIHSNLRIGYHVDTIEEALTLSENKLTCCPDVSRGKARMFYKGKIWAECCGWWCEWLPEHNIRSADCKECFLLGKGCFALKGK